MNRSKQKFLVIVTIFILALFCFGVQVFALSFDSKYGINGVSSSSVYPEYPNGNNMIVQTDGKVIIAGYENVGSYKSWKLQRFNVNGTIDETFGIKGSVIKDFGYDTSIKGGLVLSKDDSFIVVGDSNSVSSGLLLMKYDRNGSPIESYGINGSVSTTIAGSDSIQPRAVVLSEDGKLLITGYQHYDGFYRTKLFLMRYSDDGSLDASFGDNGTVLIDYPYARYNSGANIAINKDGKIIVVGALGGVGGDPLVTYQFNNDGSIDYSFGTNGYVYDHFGPQYDISTDTIVQTDGKIVITGYTIADWARPSAFVLRYNADGSRDTTFANNGLFENVFGMIDSKSNALISQSDGKILLGGMSFNGSRYNPTMRRINDDGSIDIEFNNSLLSYDMGYEGGIYNLIKVNEETFFASITDGINNYRVLKFIDELYTNPSPSTQPMPTIIHPTNTPIMSPSPSIIEIKNSIVVDDSKFRSNPTNDKWHYVGDGWINCTKYKKGCNILDIDNTYSLTDSMNDYALLTFTGKQVVIYGSKGQDFGIIGVQLDDEREVRIDNFSEKFMNNIPVWQSKILRPGKHVVKLRVTGEKNTKSSGFQMMIDKGEIIKSSKLYN